MNRERPTSLYSRYLLPLVWPFPNFDVPFIAPFRRKAVSRLALSRGDRVLDVGCGAGGSFKYLRDAVGPTGEVVGVELSPAVAAMAKRRVEHNDWPNVKVVESAAQTVALDGMFDAAIMFGANEIFTSKQALDNIFAHLKPGARILVMGAKLVERGPRAILNPLYRAMTAWLMLPTTPRLTLKPFDLLQARMGESRFEELGGGFLFMFWGVRGEQTLEAEQATARETGHAIETNERPHSEQSQRRRATWTFRYGALHAPAR